MNYCTYCGMPQGDRLSCCGENHWQTAEEFHDYHGCWPDDDSEEFEHYEQLERGYAKDRI